jgi:hypothetical protein
MSHYPVLVCVDRPDQLAAALAPFDENLQVPPYPVYLTGAPADSPPVAALRRHTGWRPDLSTLTWAQVAEVSAAQAPDADWVVHIDDDGRPYQLSRYNPAAKWDWWRTGGRWSGMLSARPDTDTDSRIIRASDPQTYAEPGACDGGPRGLLDLAGMRDRAEARARRDYAAYQRLVGDLPPALPWRDFAARVDPAARYGIDQARGDYHNQPAMRALEAAGSWLTCCPIEHFAGGLDAYVHRERLHGPLGYALLTTDGRWLAPGRMGWFAVSDDTPASRLHYAEQATACLDELDPDVYVICVDCHI